MNLEKIALVQLEVSSRQQTDNVNNIIAAQVSND